jgi:hypothetical protein
MQQLDERNKVRMLGSEPDSREPLVVASAGAAVAGKQERMMDSRVPPEGDSIRVVPQHRLKMRAGLKVEGVVRIKAHEQEPRIDRADALIRLGRESLIEAVGWMPKEHACDA